MKITVRQLKQLIKEEVNRTMLLESEEATMINPKNGDIIKVDDENNVRVVDKAIEGSSLHAAMIGYEEWERNGFPSGSKREEPSGPMHHGGRMRFHPHDEGDYGRRGRRGDDY